MSNSFRDEKTCELVNRTMMESLKDEGYNSGFNDGFNMVLQKVKKKEILRLLKKC